MKKTRFQLAVIFLLFINGMVSAQISAGWKATGPIAFPINVSGQINGIGRVCQVKFHPSNPTKIYAASASGGLWISNNAGQNWKSLGTDYLPSTSCASVCIDFTNDSILYLGTGDPNYYGTNLGVWKSTDAGTTWFASNSGIGTRMAVELLMNPTNSNELIAATNDGIWKSYNGGQTWSVKKSGGAFKDMKFKASLNTDTLFAVTSSQYYRSTNMGETWTLITAGVFVPNGNGEGMRIAVSKANPDVVYLGLVADGGTILISVNGGTSFTTAYHNPAQMLNGYDASTSGQGNYNFGITADPLNADNVFVVAHCVWRSNDAGITWSKLTAWASDCHTDMHEIIYSPYNHNNLLNANDGGIFVSHDDGDNWDPFSDGLEATECYHAAQSPLVTNMISIGTQDNGELFYDNQWKTNRGGDWTARMAFDYQQFNRVYYFNGDRRPVSGSDQSWAKPFTGDARAMAFTPLNTNLAFVASQNSVYRTSNLNAGTPSWSLISSNTSTIRDIALSPVSANELYVVFNNLQIKYSSNALAATPTFTTLTAPSSTANTASLSVLKSNTNVVYLACGSKVYRSANQGSNWVNITYNLPAINIIKIFIDNFSPIEAVYACSALGVYYKNDTMTTWANYSQGLPSIADIQDFMMTNNGTVSSNLRVAYYGRGVFESGLYQPYLQPSAGFTSNDTLVCANTSVNFNSTSSLNSLVHSWSFPGGIPSTSNLKNPAVVYPNAGTYSVSLTVSNSNGSDSITKTSYITVQGTNPLPLQEGFAGNFPPSSWTIIDAGNDGVNWSQSLSVGGYAVSNECMYFDNYNYDAQGKYDAIRSPIYDLSGVTHAELKFDVAYAVNAAPYLDTLLVYISSDCNSSFTAIFQKDPFSLATAPASPNTTFVPSSTQWRTELINLDAFAGQSDVSITFQNRGYAGQVVYIDNILIDEPLGVKSNLVSNSISVYPNPGNGYYVLEIQSKKAEECTLELYNLLGELVQSEQRSIANGQNKLVYNLSAKEKGIYSLRIKNAQGNLIGNKKIVVN